MENENHRVYGIMPAYVEEMASLCVKSEFRSSIAALIRSVSLERLINKCIMYRHPLGTSFVDRLVAVLDVRERSELETTPIAKRWSRARLNREIRLRYGGRRNLALNTSRFTSGKEALSELSRLTTKLIRWGVMMGWNPNTGRVVSCDERQITLDDLPDNINKLAKRAFRIILQLQSNTVSALERGRE